MKTSPCKGCGRPIVWAKLPSGGAVPLDPKPAVYRVLENGHGELVAERANEDQEGQCWHLVSHFATCPKANQFSKSKPKPAELTQPRATDP